MKNKLFSLIFLVGCIPAYPMEIQQYNTAVADQSDLDQLPVELQQHIFKFVASGVFKTKNLQQFEQEAQHILKTYRLDKRCYDLMNDIIQKRIRKEFKADLAQQTDEAEDQVLNETPLYEYCSRKHGEELLRKKAQEFCAKQHLSIETFNIDKNINAVDEELNTLLVYVVMANDLSLGKLLLQYGAYVNCFNSRYLSPLSIAAEFGHADFAKLLLSYQALPNGFSFSKSPLAYAIKSASICGEQKALEMVQALEEHGADLAIEDPTGFNAIALSVHLKFRRITRFLLEHR